MVYPVVDEVHNLNQNVWFYLQYVRMRDGITYFLQFEFAKATFP